MTIHWDALLAVLAVSLGSTVAVVVLVTVALLGLSARTTGTAGRAAVAPARRRFGSPTTGSAVAVVCLLGAGAIAATGLWVLVAR